MSKEKSNDTDQQQFWQMVFETFNSSDLSVRQFCKREGLSEPSFYSWRKRLSKNEKPKVETVKKDQPFIQISMPDQQCGALELILTSGNTLKINSRVESKTLTDVISVLSKAGLC